MWVGAHIVKKKRSKSIGSGISDSDDKDLLKRKVLIEKEKAFE
ncbi:hypothetical protein C5167_034338 [Papaver somniferum]|uniref:Uncharacterized protein n=1 Tax=Papaver somniferum TaxID=3469 RepID=A0A4Y7KFL4_PAPSO|nr:hypothetical protein C5167_034338 [Papaver somniferum]